MPRSDMRGFTVVRRLLEGLTVTGLFCAYYNTPRLLGILNISKSTIKIWAKQLIMLFEYHSIFKLSAWLKNFSAFNLRWTFIICKTLFKITMVKPWSLPRFYSGVSTNLHYLFIHRDVISGQSNSSLKNCCLFIKLFLNECLILFRTVRRCDN